MKLYFKIKNGTITLYSHNFLVTENVQVEPQRYNFRHKRRVIIPIPPREYKKRNTKYQLRQLVLSTENRLLQRVEHYSIHSFAWAPAGIFPGGGKPLGGPPKNL